MSNPKKSDLRKKCQSARDTLSLDERHKKSQMILSRLLEEDYYKSASSIGFYCSFGSEVETAKMLDASRLAGKQVYLPKIFPGPKQIKFYEFHGEVGTLACNYFGIMEPQGETLSSEDSLELIVVPGLAFDREGWRLGYGAGYYDRFLKTTTAPTIGIAFDLQVKKSIPIGKNDVPLDLVITENNTFKRSELKPVFDSAV